MERSSHLAADGVSGGRLAYRPTDCRIRLSFVSRSAGLGFVIPGFGARRWFR
jgi:hypothetical protein